MRKNAKFCTFNEQKQKTINIASFTVHAYTYIWRINLLFQALIRTEMTTIHFQKIKNEGQRERKANLYKITKKTVA